MGIAGIIAWVKLHWLDIVAVYTALVTVASFIVKFTPTLKDDDWLLKVVKFLGKYIAVNKNAPTEAERAAIK